MESKGRNTEINIKNIFDPNSVHALEYARDMSEIYRERLTDPEYINQILLTPEEDGASKLVIESRIMTEYLISGLEFGRFLMHDSFPEKIDYLKEIANHSIFLLNETNIEKSEVGKRFLSIYLYARANSLLEENFGPDFSSVYRLMLANTAKVIDQTIQNVKQVPSIDHIGPSFEQRISNSLEKTLIHDQPRVIEAHIQNNFWKINEYIQMNSSNQPEDTPNLDIALLKFFVKFEDIITNSEIAEYFHIDQLISFKLIGERVLSVLEERDELIYGVDEESGQITYSVVPNPKKVIPIIFAHLINKRRKKQRE